MEDTELMGWVDHNKLYLTGSITSGLTLSIANSGTGSIPSDMSLSTYGDYNYSASTYEITAVYQGTYESSFSVSDINWISTGGTGDIMYQTNESDDGVSYDGWTDESDAIATTNIQINKPYFKFRFIFYSPSWADTDSIYISTIQQYFKQFQKGERIYANEMNENFKVVGAGDLMPRGGNGMLFTTGVYDIGSTGYKWKTIHVNKLNFTGEIKETLTLITSTSISSTATSFDVEGLGGYASDTYWKMDYMLHVNTPSSSSFKIYFNQDSANSYYFNNAFLDSRETGFSVSGIDFGKLPGSSDTRHDVSFDGFIHTKPGQYRMIVGGGQHQKNTYTSAHYFIAGSWLDSSSTITSINFRLATGGSFNPGSKVNLYRRNS
jgi:hypothetical protein